jgi:hypothetical protein
VGKAGYQSPAFVVSALIDIVCLEVVDLPPSFLRNDILIELLRTLISMALDFGVMVVFLLALSLLSAFVRSDDDGPDAMTCTVAFTMTDQFYARFPEIVRN